ncbi:glycosyltransferase family 2 protein [Winogradskyella vidalii]|uniref:glycosyltransferase family 2 protein n=1 Tax=Winogradskyella vidalii TaxID=2615024 RepID=UPI0015CB9D27|nr:glycosyltransferase family 2 protein [Winogradskyella vidalii]
MQPLVSIVTPIYNNADVIKNTINSVLNQTYINWELLLIDDASSDGTVGVVKPFIEVNSRVKLFVHKTNKGVAKARNLGTKMAKGNYIAFLDADDLWKENKLELQINNLVKNVTDLSFGSYEWIDSKGDSLNIKVNALKSLSYNRLLKANYIGNLTGIYNCGKLGKVYTKNLKKRQDWLLWLEVLNRSDKPAVGIQETIAYYRITEGSLSSNKTSLIKHNFNVYRKGLEFSLIKSLAYLIQFLFEHLFIKKRLIAPIISK